VQSEFFKESEYVPLRHKLHFELPISFAKYPKLQGKQFRAPKTGLKVPLSQGTQVTKPCRGA